MAHNEQGRGWNEPKKLPRDEREAALDERAEQHFFERIGEHDPEVEEPELHTE